MRRRTIAIITLALLCVSLTAHAWDGRRGGSAAGGAGLSDPQAAPADGEQTFSGAIGATNVTASGTITDGTASITGGDVSSVGTLTATTITDGTATLTSGSLTGAVNGSFSGNITLSADDKFIGAGAAEPRVEFDATANESAWYGNALLIGQNGGADTHGSVTMGDVDATSASILTIVDGGAEKPGQLCLYTGEASGVPYWLWIDSSGNLRKHTSAPTDEDADGTTLGGQDDDFAPADGTANFTGAVSVSTYIHTGDALCIGGTASGSEDVLQLQSQGAVNNAPSNKAVLGYASGIGKCMLKDSSGATGLWLGGLECERLETDDNGELTISTGAITATGTFHSVDTESDAASDDLSTISGGVDGDWLVIMAENDARSVVIKNGTGNIMCGADKTLDSDDDTALLIYSGAVSKWVLVSFSDNS